MKKLVILISFIVFYLCSIQLNSENETISYVQNIFIGDSRTVGMYLAAHSGKYRNEVNALIDDEYWCCKVGAGYKYMVDVAVPSMEPYISSGTNLYILFGVNDAKSSTNVNHYSLYLRDKSVEWYAKGANVFYVTAGPVSEYKFQHGVNWVSVWNVNIKSECIWTFMNLLDLYSDIDSQISIDSDGIHYNNDSYLLMYEYLLENSKTFHYSGDLPFLMNKKNQLEFVK